jgi:hypothetical protein
MNSKPNTMKKNVLLLNLVLTTFAGFAQCDPSTINDMPTVYTKEFSGGWKLTPEQVKYMTNIFTSIVEPAIKSTKGLKCSWKGLDGDWEFSGGFNATPDGLTTTTIRMYMPVMACSKDKKIYQKDESGLVIHFDFNSLHFVGETSRNETYRNNEKVFIPNKIAGAQIYQLKQNSGPYKYSPVAFYCQTDDAKYFLISKKESPFFIPVTIKQALELSINNMTAEIAETNKQSASLTILSKEAWIKKEGIKPIEGAITVKQAQEVNDAGYQGYVEGSKGVSQGNNFNLSSYKKSIEISKEVLKTAPPDILAKPATSNMLSSFYSDISELKQLINDKPRGGFLVTINSGYLKTNLPKTAPQFICIEIRTQTNDAVTLKAFKSFEDSIDFEKLQQQLAK